MTERMYTVTVPGKFADWFGGTNLVIGRDDDDPDCKTLRLVWEGRYVQKSGNGYFCQLIGNKAAMLLLKEYGDYCVNANIDDPNPVELKAAREVIKRVNKVLTEKKEDIHDQH